jgi:hypothetical protein
MYRAMPGLVLGYHGCDQAVGEAIIAGTSEMRLSQNDWDWLGPGCYFWESNHERALDYAKELKRKPRGESRVHEPFAIGAVLDLGICMNLVDTGWLELLREGYKLLARRMTERGESLPSNQLRPDGEVLVRPLDCMVIQTTIAMYESWDADHRVDSVRGAFLEGEALYPGAGMRSKNHIQLCIRNPNCIKGYFRVRKADQHHPVP